MVVVTNALMMALFDKEALMGIPDETHMHKDIENTYPKKSVNVFQFAIFFNFCFYLLHYSKLFHIKSATLVKLC